MFEFMDYQNRYVYVCISSKSSKNVNRILFQKLLVHFLLSLIFSIELNVCTLLILNIKYFSSQFNAEQQWSSHKK